VIGEQDLGYMKEDDIADLGLKHIAKIRLGKSLAAFKVQS
jgi:hypothetical protein